MKSVDWVAPLSLLLAFVLYPILLLHPPSMALCLSFWVSVLVWCTLSPPFPANARGGQVPRCLRGVGPLCNATAMLVNGGVMPVRPPVRPAGVLHVAMTASSKLPWLCDTVGPWRVSLGDLFIGGSCLTGVLAMVAMSRSHGEEPS